jgi:predicted SAM-dependent methyltransferase
MDAQNITLDEKFDVIIASDCLEHLKEDEKALKNWYELLNKNGVAFIFVPAFMSLWSYHDEYNMHYRRYTNSELNPS